uniref:Thiamine-phosphate synthase n=1 Tax=Candidatus Kentrum sp. MB TaxID=2138164 RepID=A0A450XS21_9GAMM|nr:MAG: thiamine-phosphate pyrophosphorylase [Candidatus Kentron sp. MB]VFK32075.1 MAG: thiamine-phosphate pyrophosphorylase [Candidatus Kentron sp. MB]VFK75657.1 MAG: thiamine-phosphate pyrophosphorylase [Candidatus Kentron sp. MB]
MTPLPRQGLYALTDSLLLSGNPVSAVESAIRGGATVIQYRDKGTDDKQRREEAEALLTVCRAHGTPLIINDDVELAAAIGADGVHIGKHDLPLSIARERLGARGIIGVSCYNAIENAERAQREGADYVAFGRFFPSHTKPLATPVTIGQLAKFRHHVHLPIVAIGGITPENGASLLTAGADFLAVIHGVFGQPDVEMAAREYAMLFA